MFGYAFYLPLWNDAEEFVVLVDLMVIGSGGAQHWPSAQLPPPLLPRQFNKHGIIVTSEVYAEPRL